MTKTRRDRQAGFVGGVEVLPFGVLIFVAGALLITNAWAVIDTKMATSSAAREATRSYVEADSAHDAESAARDSAGAVMSSYGRRVAEMELDITGAESFERCARVTVEVRYRVPAFSLPFGIGLGHGTDVSSKHSEIIDPLRSGLEVGNDCGF